MNIYQIMDDPFGSTDLMDLDSSYSNITEFEKDYRFDIAFKKVNIKLNDENIYKNRIMNNLFIKSVYL